jgi:16S rRNA U1498 N3-methylase RsmE
MPDDLNEKIKEAVYVALTGGTFYYAAKLLRMDANAALIVGTAVGKILATPSKIKNHV